MAGKRRSFTIEEKYKIIRRLEEGTLNKEVCEQMQIKQSTLSTIWKSRDRIKDLMGKDMTGSRKVKWSKYREVEGALLEWYRKEKGQGDGVSTIALLRKAREIGKQYEAGFRYSTSWVARFRRRYNILKQPGTNEADNETTQSSSFEKVPIKTELKEEELLLSDQNASGSLSEGQTGDGGTCTEYGAQSADSAARPEPRSLGRVYSAFAEFVAASMLALTPRRRIATEKAICGLLLMEKEEALSNDEKRN